jgi:hypothetical protein
MSDRSIQIPGRNSFASPGDDAIPWWVRAAVVVGALLMATGAILALVNPAMLVGPHEEINGAVRVFAGYLFARNGALAVMLIALLTLGAKRALSQTMILVALIQFLDAGVDCAEGRWVIAPGVVVFGIVFLIGASKLSRSPIWSVRAWK